VEKVAAHRAIDAQETVPFGTKDKKSKTMEKADPRQFSGGTKPLDQSIKIVDKLREQTKEERNSPAMGWWVMGEAIKKEEEEERDSQNNHWIGSGMGPPEKRR